MTAAIVLAGGGSRRFGADKLAAVLPDGRSVLAHAVAVAAEVAGEVVVVVAPDGARPAGLPRTATVVHDPEPDAGPLLGLIAGLFAARAAVVLVIGGDMPALQSSVLRLLIASVEVHPDVEAARLEAEGWAGGSVLPCVVRRAAAQRACRDALAAGDRRLRGCLERLATTVVATAEWRALDPTGRTLIDIDLPADLDRSMSGHDESVQPTSSSARQVHSIGDDRRPPSRRVRG